MPSGGGLILYQAYGNLYAMIGIKRRRHDLYSDGVMNLTMASGCGRLKEDLESSTWRQSQDFKATPIVIMIVSLDQGNPLHLHANDSNYASIVSIKLNDVENYIIYTSVMKIALLIKYLIGFINGSCNMVDYVASSPLLEQWDRFNVQTRGREAVFGMTWEDFKTLTREELCPNNEMQKLKTEFCVTPWSRLAMLHTLIDFMSLLATEPTTIQSIVLKAGMLTDEAIRNGSLKKNTEKRGNIKEPCRDGNARDDNKSSRTRRALATVTNPIRKEYTGADFRVEPRMVNPLNAINPIAARRASFECGGTDHYRATCPRSSSARAMIELRADVELKDNIVVAMPKITSEGHYTCNVRVYYEWKPPRCSSCKVFRNIHVECPKNTGAGVKPTIEVSNSNPFDVLNSVDNDEELGTYGGTTNLVNNEATSSGSSFMNVDNNSIGFSMVLYIISGVAVIFWLYVGRLNVVVMRVYNHRARKIMEKIHVKFVELTTMASEYKSLKPASKRKKINDSSAYSTEIPSKEHMENLFGLLFDEYFGSSSKEVPNVSATSEEHSSAEPVNFVDASNQEDNVAVDVNEFVKPFSTFVYEEDESYSSALGLENQVQRLMEAHLAPMQPTQVIKVTTSCEICSGPHDTQYCMENPAQAFVEYVSSHINEAGVKDVEVHIEKLKVLNDFYVIDMKKDPETPLLVGRGFLATTNVVIDCKKAKIVIRERITRDVLVFRRMVKFLGAIPIDLKSNMWESKDLIKNPINWDKPPKNGDRAWHAKIRLIDPD
nr:ribonuclease H-like domain-containing protein [Tanacetum cinerariifolium]